MLFLERSFPRRPSTKIADWLNVFEVFFFFFSFVPFLLKLPPLPPGLPLVEKDLQGGLVRLLFLLLLLCVN